MCCHWERSARLLCQPGGCVLPQLFLFFWLGCRGFVWWAVCERGEEVQGVLTLFCSGAAQVCHDDRVVELKEQLEVEEEDGDRQEEEVEEKGEVESKRVRHG